MNFWSKSRSFAEEAAKKSSELTKEAVTRTQDLDISSSRLADIVSRSRELAAEATKRADQIKGVRLGDQCDHVPGFSYSRVEMDFTDDTENVRQDLTEFQEKHAKLVPSSVKEISKLRYQLCPRIMKDQKFWRIYFLLVNSHITLYEKQYMEDKLKASEEEMEKSRESQNVGEVFKTVAKNPSLNMTFTKSSIDQNLGVVLLGDPGDDEEGTNEVEGGFGDDFDKMVDSSDDHEEKAELI